MLFWRKKNDDNDDDDDVDDFLTGQGHWEEFKTSILPGTPIVMANGSDASTTPTPL